MEKLSTQSSNREGSHSQSHPHNHHHSQKGSWYSLSLTQQIFLGLIVGVFLGWGFPEFSIKIAFLRDIFMNLIKSIIAPLLFSTIVIGITGAGDLKKVGRIGLKSLIYFELVTGFALLIGMAIANWVEPGKGIQLNMNTDVSTIGKLAHTQPKTLIQTIVHLFPSSIVESMAKGDVLQIVFFSLMFAIAVSSLGARGKVIVDLCESLAQVMFRLTGYVMKFAPYGIGAAMAHTVAEQGLAILKNLGLLIGSLYFALFLFIVLILFPIAFMARVPLWNFIKAIREPFAIAFVTTSSESALPKALEMTERLGVPRHIAGFVLPTGYSFNLDGTTLYLALASIFVGQVAESSVPGFQFTLEQQLTMMLTLMVTSKGVAAVPRASLVVLMATAGSFFPKEVGPIAIAMIFGVDELMDMARTSVNVLGNCLAAVVISRWEGEFDDARALAFGTEQEQPLMVVE